MLPLGVYQFCDTATAIAVLIGVLVARNVARMPSGVNDFLAVRLSLKNVLLLGFFLLAWRLICRACGLYRPTDSPATDRKRVIAAGALTAPVAGVFSLTSVSGAFDAQALALFVVSLMLALLLMRAGLGLIERSRSKPQRNVLIVGSGPRARAIAQQLRADPDQAVQIVGFVDFQTDALEEPGDPAVIVFEELEPTLMHGGIDEVVVGLPLRSQYLTVERVVATCERIGVPVTLPADTFRSSRAQPRPRDSGGLLAFTFAEATRDYRHWVKRGIDLVGASLALVLTAPLFVLIALAVKLTSPGPVLYAQERYGFNRHRFRMLKFRTMVAGAEAMLDQLEHLNEAAGPLFKIRHDPRITPVGKLLRRCSLDELPQLLNVLRGEMSLVGPRPMSIRDVYKFTEASLMRRFSVMPGMTGLWQVSGRNALLYDEWARADISYVDGWSLWLDLRILVRTIPAVIRGTGAE
jgi:exopolysaccharide biosynthesis polyprenyl glycosylphosphotransferase